jgi:hypothetical protein
MGESRIKVLIELISENKEFIAINIGLFQFEIKYKSAKKNPGTCTDLLFCKLCIPARKLP